MGSSTAWVGLLLLALSGGAAAQAVRVQNEVVISSPSGSYRVALRPGTDRTTLTLFDLSSDPPRQLFVAGVESPVRVGAHVTDGGEVLAWTNWERPDTPTPVIIFDRKGRRAAAYRLEDFLAGEELLTQLTPTTVNGQVGMRWARPTAGSVFENGEVSITLWNGEVVRFVVQDRAIMRRGYRVETSTDPALLSRMLGGSRAHPRAVFFRKGQLGQEACVLVRGAGTCVAAARDVATAPHRAGTTSQAFEEVMGLARAVVPYLVAGEDLRPDADHVELTLHGDGRFVMFRARIPEGQSDARHFLERLHALSGPPLVPASQAGFVTDMASLVRACEQGRCEESSLPLGILGFECDASEARVLFEMPFDDTACAPQAVPAHPAGPHLQQDGSVFVCRIPADPPQVHRNPCALRLERVRELCFAPARARLEGVDETCEPLEPIGLPDGRHYDDWEIPQEPLGFRLTFDLGVGYRAEHDPYTKAMLGAGLGADGFVGDHVSLGGRIGYAAAGTDDGTPGKPLRALTLAPRLRVSPWLDADAKRVARFELEAGFGYRFINVAGKHPVANAAAVLTLGRFAVGLRYERAIDRHTAMDNTWHAFLERPTPWFEGRASRKPRVGLGLFAVALGWGVGNGQGPILTGPALELSVAFGKVPIVPVVRWDVLWLPGVEDDVLASQSVLAGVQWLEVGDTPLGMGALVGYGASHGRAPRAVGAGAVVDLGVWITAFRFLPIGIHTRLGIEEQSGAMRALYLSVGVREIL